MHVVSTLLDGRSDRLESDEMRSRFDVVGTDKKQGASRNSLRLTETFETLLYNFVINNKNKTKIIIVSLIVTFFVLFRNLED